MKMMSLVPAAAAALIVSALLPAAAAQKAGSAGEYFVYAGTYTKTKSKGIYVYRFQPATGKLAALGLAAESVNPSFLAVDPSQRFLYAANEAGEGGNAASAFRINPQTGQLEFLNKVTSRGDMPCHLVVDKTGKMLIVANYGSGSVAAFPIQPDGRLGEASAFSQHAGSSVNPQRQQGPHAHAVVLTPDNKFVLCPDLGLDRVFVYRIDPAKGSLALSNPPFATVKPGSGPRHLAFHPNGKFVYVINELASTMTTYAFQAAAGTLNEIQTLSTLPADFTGRSSTAEVEVARSGRFVYGSNRGHDSIAVFAVDAKSGRLTLVENTPTQGKTPRNFALDPSGAYLFAANQNTDNIVLFRVDPKTGRLEPSGEVVNDVGAPVCVVFVPTK